MHLCIYASIHPSIHPSGMPKHGVDCHAGGENSDGASTNHQYPRTDSVPVQMQTQQPRHYKAQERTRASPEQAKDQRDVWNHQCQSQCHARQQQRHKRVLGKMELVFFHDTVHVVQGFGLGFGLGRSGIRLPVGIVVQAGPILAGFLRKQWLSDVLGFGIRLRLRLRRRRRRGRKRCGSLLVLFLPHLDQADAGGKHVERKCHDHCERHSEKGHVQ
mmetsp:Transcript_19013/g.43940  ORF Transcript_19013/g.43940 Transcript_19013/m.43940 type:complete len:216 (-) Transcript_19013:1150-1797(-)